MTKEGVTFDLQDPVFSGDRFRMYEFKIKRCPKAKPHDWTQCPFAHPGEKAKRRDPRRFTYSGSACPEFRKVGVCSRGDACPLAHGVFETWLHPTRYKTQMCMDGGACRRKVCFFAHSQSELRMVPPGTAPITGPPFGMDAGAMTSDALLQQAMLGQQHPQQQLELLHLLANNPTANPNLMQQSLGMPTPPPGPPPPQQDVAALLAAAGMPPSALTTLLAQQQQHGATPPSIAMQGSVIPASHGGMANGSPLSGTTSMASSLPLNQDIPSLYRHDSIMSTPAPIHDQSLLGPPPGSLHRHLSLDARRPNAYSPNTTPAPLGSPAPDAALDPALTAVLQKLNLGGSSMGGGPMLGGGPTSLEPVCEATALEHGVSGGSMTSTSLLRSAHAPSASHGGGGGGFVLPHDYHLTSRSTVDNGVLAHMREIATTELSKLSDKELAALTSQVYGGSGTTNNKGGTGGSATSTIPTHGGQGHATTIAGGDMQSSPRVAHGQQHTPRATPSPSFAATTPSGAGVLSVAASSLGGATHSPSVSPSTGPLMAHGSNHGSQDGVPSPSAFSTGGMGSSGGIGMGSAATTPMSAALWAAEQREARQHDIKRNFSIERLLSELPRSMSDMDVSQILAVQPAGVAVAGGAVQ